MAQFKVQLQALNPATESLTLFLTPNVELLVGRMSTCNIQLPIPTISNIVRTLLVGALTYRQHLSDWVRAALERQCHRGWSNLSHGSLLERKSRSCPPYQ